MKRNENDRRGWTIVALSLLIGLLCVIVAGDLAIRLAPTWRLQADMRSRLNPDIAYLTPPAEVAFRPLDPAILTPPVWIEGYLTPGAAFPTRVIIPHTETPLPTFTKIPATNQPTSSPTPTLTFVYLIPTRESTANPSITRTATVPMATSTVTRTATATATDTATTTAAKTSAPMATATRTATPTVTRTPTVTATSTATHTPTATATSTATATPTNTSLPEADLQITIDDNATSYDGGAIIQYTIVASNPAGPAAALGAGVTSNFSVNLTNITWTCSASAGASCTGSGTGNINDSVNLPAGSFVTYRVDAQVVSSPSGPLTSSVQISPPPGITDPNLGNNQATDSNDLIVLSPPGKIGPVKDNEIEYIPVNTTVTLQFSTPVMVGGHPGYDLVYYELPQGPNPGIYMDCVDLQVGDGRNWYTVLNWCDNRVDTNASMNMNTIGAGAETDNYLVDASQMYDLTGVALELDGYVPNGSYKFFRIVSYSTPPDDGDGVEVDAVYGIP